MQARTLGSCRATQAFPAARATRRLSVVVTARRSNTADAAPSISIHGRHMQVTEDIASHVHSALTTTIAKLRGAEFLEGEGGVESVDVRLMNSQADVTLTPRVTNKQLHDTFLRQGKLTASASGTSALDSFDKAMDVLEKKLKPWTRAPPVKTDTRRTSQLRNNGRSSGPLR